MPFIQLIFAYHHLLLVEVALVSQHDRDGLGTDSRYIDGLAESNIQSFSLSDRIKGIALVPPQDIALLVDEGAAFDPLFQALYLAL